MNLRAWFQAVFKPRPPPVFIVDGVKYDLGTAKHIAWRQENWGDDRYGGTSQESLYRGEKGKFFTYGNFKSNGRMEINAVSDDEAKKWCEKHAWWAYESLFGPVESA